ncbi:hypothetical protein N184_28820 [Sinorhizobium sp. GL28]|nr:hypothetical protein N184_28820 [Sinorhizobium sp. GL28]
MSKAEPRSQQGTKAAIHRDQAVTRAIGEPAFKGRKEDWAYPGRSQGLKQLRRNEVARLYPTIKHVGLWKPSHLDNPIDSRSAFLKSQVAGKVGVQWLDASISLSGQSTIEADFFTAEEVASVNGAEVEKGPLDRFLQLQHPIISHEDP